MRPIYNIDSWDIKEKNKIENNMAEIDATEVLDYKEQIQNLNILINQIKWTNIILLYGMIIIWIFIIYLFILINIKN